MYHAPLSTLLDAYETERDPNLLKLIQFHNRSTVDFELISL